MDNGTVVFPGKYALAHKLINTDTSLVCGIDRQKVTKQVGNKTEYGFIDIMLGGKPFFIALRGFRVYKSPCVSRSGSSQAMYLANSINKQDGFLLQYLPPRSITSKHYHEYTREAFHPLAGNAVIHTPRGVNYVLVSGKSIKINPYTIHQVRTKENDSLILLEMISEFENPGMKDHIYVDEEGELNIY